jgi:hypothetical protein
MILPAGLAIRFKCSNSDTRASEFAEPLRGYCSVQGSKVVITKTVRYEGTVTDVDLSIFRSNGE